MNTLLEAPESDSAVAVDVVAQQSRVGTVTEAGVDFAESGIRSTTVVRSRGETPAAHRPETLLRVTEHPVPAVSPSSVSASPEPGRFPAPRPLPVWKRVLDLCLLGAVAPVAGPMLIAAALWVRAVSPGKLLFVQERVGTGGRRFRCYKLRTMREGCAVNVHQSHLVDLLKQDRPMQKLDGVDPRLIPGAKLLRALGVDELPQLWNVVRGEMSIIGPRPCIPYEAEQYGDWHRERFSVQPGMTGLWQVKGKNSTTFTQMIALDIEYARTRSLRLDLWILLATPRALVRQLVQVVARKSRRSQRPSSSSTSVPMPTTGESGVLG